MKGTQKKVIEIKLTAYVQIKDNICIVSIDQDHVYEIKFQGNPVNIFPLKNSPIEIQDANEIILLIFVSQKITGIIKLGDASIKINNGSPKRVINLKGDKSGLNSNAEIIHENPNRK